MALRMRRTGAVEEPLTGGHFLTYRAEASSSANGTYWIKRVPRPILMVRDAGDTIRSSPMSCFLRPHPQAPWSPA
jgi:hypothetical protein